MSKPGLLLALVPLFAAAQAPTINPDGIVRADTTRPGLLAPGIVFSIWGHGYGPKAGCHGPANEVCAVQVLVDGAPIEVQYTNDVLINARMPDAQGPAVSKLVVVSGGLRSDPVEVRRLPETAVIALDGTAHINGPVWIHVALPRSLGVSYPVMGVPWDFACDAFEVRKDGRPLTPIAHPQLGQAYSGPSCPGTVNLGDPQKLSRLPLHLQYDFTAPGVYEVRLSHYGDFARRPEDIRIQSAWTKIEILPAGPRQSIATRPQEPNELLRDTLPSLLASRDDENLRILIEYLYHPSPRVRSYAAAGIYYWPDVIAEPLLLEALKKNGPSPAIIQRLAGHTAEVAHAAIDYLFSDDPVLFDGAIRAAGAALNPRMTIDPALRLQVEQRVVAAVNGNLGHADAQMTVDLVALLGQIHTQQVHDLLWNLVGNRTAIQQALICIAWQSDPKDLPRLTEYMLASAQDDRAGRELSGVPYAMRTHFGDAALPWLRTALEKVESPALRLRCAEELMRAKDPAAFSFALDAIGQKRAWNPQIRTMVNDQFPETRNMPDAEISQFLRDRAM